MQRRLLLTLCPLAAVALVAPAASSAAEPGKKAATTAAATAAPVAKAADTQLTDGNLTVRSANGLLLISGRGSVLGQVVGKARILIEDTDPSDGVPVVSGYDRAQRQGRFAVLYSGSDLRFRLLTGTFKLRIQATGISLSFVGRGTASLVPAGTLDDGAYSLDGGETYRPLGFGATTNVVVGAVQAVLPQAISSGSGAERP